MYYETDYLAHYGVIGMKWGVRRYQNKDGSLTAKGKRHRKQQYAAEARTMNDADLKKSVDRLNMEKQYKDMVSAGGRQTRKLEEASRKAERGSKVAGALKGENSSAAQLGKSSQSFLKNAAEASRGFDKVKASKKSSKIDLSHMSDAELRSHINRLQMETRYADLKYEDATRGRKSVGRFLENSANTILVGASAVQLAKKAKPYIVRGVRNTPLAKPIATAAVTSTIKKARRNMVLDTAEAVAKGLL